MSKDTLSEYGRDTKQGGPAPATSGGAQTPRDVRAYQPPMGPIGIGNPKSPGLHGDNYGTSGCPDAKGGQSGSAGIGGDNKGRGTNR